MVMTWEVSNDKIRDHEEVQRRLWTYTLEKWPWVKDRQRYFIHNDGSKEIRVLVLTGFKDMSEIEEMQKTWNDEGFEEIKQDLRPCMVPDTEKIMFWHDGVTWSSD